MANRPIPCLIHSSQTTSRNKSGFFNFFSVESSIRYTLLLFGVFFTFWIACFIFLLVEVPVDFLFSDFLNHSLDRLSLRCDREESLVGRIDRLEHFNHFANHRSVRFFFLRFNGQSRLLPHDAEVDEWYDLVPDPAIPILENSLDVSSSF